MDPAVSQGIGIGLAGGAFGLFLIHLAPMFRDPSLRFPVQAPDEQTDADAFVTSVIAFTAMGVVLAVTGDLVCEALRTGGVPRGVLGV